MFCLETDSCRAVSRCFTSAEPKTLSCARSLAQEKRPSAARSVFHNTPEKMQSLIDAVAWAPSQITQSIRDDTHGMASHLIWLLTLKPQSVEQSFKLHQPEKGSFVRRPIKEYVEKSSIVQVVFSQNR